MWFAIYIFLCQYTIFCDYCNYVDAKALVGANVRQAREREFPFIVALAKVNPERPNEIARFCSGTLVSANSVLTAEHCLIDEILSSILIMVGAIDFARGEKFNAEWWMSYTIWHTKSNNASGSQLHDIAVIRLNNFVSVNVKAAKVSQKPIASFYGLDVSIAGWGIKPNGIVPSILETVTLKILNNNECKDRIMKLHGREINIGVNIFCTSAEPYALMSHGDSGDPIMYNNEIIGVSSGCFNELSFHPDKVNVHVHVAYYRKFILDIIKNF